MIGMPSRIGYARRAWRLISSCASASYSSGPLVSGQTRISSSLGSTVWWFMASVLDSWARRSEEHTSELQVTNAHLVCRLLLEKKKQILYYNIQYTFTSNV